MKLVLKEDERKNKNEVPVGVVIEKDNKGITIEYNLRESKQESLNHAEIIAIDRAYKNLKKTRVGKM